MKTELHYLFIALALFAGANRAAAQGTAFTYQGQLDSGGAPANGSYDLTFTLFNTNSSGVAVAGPVTNSASTVSNGLFTATIDFGAGVFTGTNYWLELAVQTNGGSGFTTLSPRQQVTPTPYAIAAETMIGTIPASQLTSIGNTNGGAGNFFVGPSGNTTTSGANNTAIGSHALNDNTSGSRNTANGVDALNDNTSGSDNTAYGTSALFSNTSGSENTANGYQALFSNTSGSENVALGYQAGNQITAGSSNIDIGNEGLSTDTNIIRIGSGQSATYLAGTIYGNGGGLTAIPVSALSTNVALLAGGNTFTGNQTIANGAIYALGGLVEQPANPGWAAVTEYDGTNNTTGFRAFVGADGIGLTGNAGQMYVGTYSDNPLSFYTDNNQRMTITAAGNVGIGTTSPGYTLDVNGNINASGTVYANGMALTSDRNAKENFTPINARAVLDKVASLPITEWNYKTDTQAEHIGPMAQDFKAAFGLDGSDDKHISVVDEGGVALAAIQGLNEKLREKEAKIQDLEQRLERLEKLVSKPEGEHEH